jgi:hypothetical protein
MRFNFLMICESHYTTLVDWQQLLPSLPLQLSGQRLCCLEVGT